MSLEIVDAKSGISGSKILDQGQRNINHKHGQISGIVNGTLVDIHKIFQTPKLFGVAEVEFDLETEPIIVNEFIESQLQIAAKKDDVGDFLSFEFGFDDDDNIEFIGDEFVPTLPELYNSVDGGWCD